MIGLLMFNMTLQLLAILLQISISEYYLVKLHNVFTLLLLAYLKYLITMTIIY